MKVLEHSRRACHCGMWPCRPLFANEQTSDSGCGIFPDQEPAIRASHTDAVRRSEASLGNVSRTVRFTFYWRGMTSNVSRAIGLEIAL